MNENYIKVGIYITTAIIIYSVAKKFGLIPKSDSTITQEQISENKNLSLSKEPIKSGKLSFSEIMSIANDLQKSIKGWGTDESLFFNSIYKIPTLADLQNVASYYSSSFNADFKSDIEDDLGKAELKKFNDFINTLK